jgi:hypothetical protein
MKIKVFTAFLGVFAFLAVSVGCAALMTGPEVASRPEVTIPGAARGVVLEELNTYMWDRGYIDRMVTDERAVYYKRTYQLYSAPFIDQRATPEHLSRSFSNREPRPEARVIFDLTESGEGLRIVATLMMIRFPESPFKIETDISDSRDGRVIQMYLDELKASM